MSLRANENPWLMHRQIGWEPRIYDTAFPYWFRVWAVANARCAPNLHAEFETGELAKLLGKRKEDGSIEAVDRRDLDKYIKQAIERELLDGISCVKCLVLPAHAVGCRLPGAYSPCDYHTGEASKVRKPVGTRRIGVETSNSDRESKRGTASSQVTASAVGQIIRHRRANHPKLPTPGSREIFAKHLEVNV